MPLRNTSLEIFAERSLRTNSVEVTFAQRGPEGRIWTAKPLEFVENEGGPSDIPPTIRLSNFGEEAQALMDELWRCGVRPTEVGGAGELGATRRHLEDMRMIAFLRLQPRG